MLYDDESAFEADTIEADDSASQTPRRRLSDEEQLYVWCLLLQNNLVGQVSPVNAKSWLKPKYERLLPDSLIVQELNRVSDTPITTDMLKAIVKRFQGTKPPYDSFRPPKARGSE